MMSTCSYGECLTIQMPGSRLTFFSLPQDHRRRTWIQNSGNSDLMGLSATAKRYFCELHFRKSDIRRQFNRCILRREAVPVPHSHPNPCESIEASNEKVNSSEHANVEENELVLELNTDEEAQPCEHDYLIVTDYEGSSRISSIQEPSEVGTDINEDELIELECINNSELLDDVEYTGLSSRTIQSSLVSNVMIQEAASTLDGYPAEHHTEEHLNESVSSSSIIPEKAYPTRRAILRRRKLRAQYRRRCRAVRAKKQKPKPAHQARRPRPATPDISLEEVAGRTEDTYFALSLVGSLERLSARKRATAKLHILRYLTELAFAED